VNSFDFILSARSWADASTAISAPSPPFDALPAPSATKIDKMGKPLAVRLT